VVPDPAAKGVTAVGARRAVVKSWVVLKDVGGIRLEAPTAPVVGAALATLPEAFVAVSIYMSVWPRSAETGV
jgi:hypothetical protein